MKLTLPVRVESWEHFQVELRNLRIQFAGRELVVSRHAGFESLATLNIKHKQTPYPVMQPNIMASLGGLFVLAYLACLIAVVLFVLRMVWRFVCAHERLAGALDIIARKLRDDARS
jgi:hypothetical protein